MPQNVQPQCPLNTTNAVNSTRVPPSIPPKRYEHSKRHTKDQPERLINATNAVKATNVHPKHSINNTKTLNATNVQPQCPI